MSKSGKFKTGAAIASVLFQSVSHVGICFGFRDSDFGFQHARGSIIWLRLRPRCAVSPICNRHRVESFQRIRLVDAEQNAILRYGRLQICATTSCAPSRNWWQCQDAPSWSSGIPRSRRFGSFDLETFQPVLTKPATNTVNKDPSHQWQICTSPPSHEAFTSRMDDVALVLR